MVLMIFFFFTSQTVWKSNYFNGTFFFVKDVDLWGSFSTVLTPFSIFVLLYRDLAVYLNWMTDVCVFVSVRLLVSPGEIEMMGCIANELSKPSVTGQER